MEGFTGSPGPREDRHCSRPDRDGKAQSVGESWSMSRGSEAADIRGNNQGRKAGGEGRPVETELVTHKRR